MKTETCPPPAENQLSFSGIVVSGARKAAFFTQLDWVRDQCLSQVGFKPFPGTLNLRLAEQDRGTLSCILRLPGRTLVPPDGTSCAGRLYPVMIGDFPGAIVVPEESVRIHDAGIVEILAPVSLRKELKLKDGDIVDLTVKL